MTIMLVAENKREFEDLKFDLRYGMYTGKKVVLRYHRKSVGRPKKKKN